MGAVWSDFTPVQQAWEETFGSKPYTTHTLAIAGEPLHARSPPCWRAPMLP